MMVEKTGVDAILPGCSMSEHMSALLSAGRRASADVLSPRCLPAD